MEAVEFIDSLEMERGSVSDDPIQPIESYAVTLRLTEGDRQALEQLKEETGQDEETTIRAILRAAAARIGAGDHTLIQKTGAGR